MCVRACGFVSVCMLWVRVVSDSIAAGESVWVGGGGLVLHVRVVRVCACLCLCVVVYLHVGVCVFFVVWVFGVLLECICVNVCAWVFGCRSD